MTDSTTLMEFPCDFQIKIIGKNAEAFVSEIATIVRKHYSSFKETDIRTQASKQANYLALTVTVHALNQITLDALYTELTKHPDIKMVL